MFVGLNVAVEGQVMFTYAPVSISVQKPICFSRHDCWLAAAIIPLLVAPLWITFARQLPGPFGTVVGMILMMLTATCAVTDLRQRKIFNWATYTAIIWGVSLSAVTEVAGPLPALGTVGLSASLTGAAICLVVMMAAYDLSGGGAGDVKLAVALGTLLGPENSLTMVAYTYVLAAAWIVLCAAWRNGPFTLGVAFLRQIGSSLFPRHVRGPNPGQLRLLERPVPLAGFFALGTLLVVLETI